MDNALIQAYLGRIGVPRPPVVDAAALRELHRRHLLSIPFENLSVHLGEEIVLTAEALVDKVVTRRRGGFCYELNGAFGALLAALGCEVTLLAARVFGDDGRKGLPYDHLALRVTAADGSGPWLMDVGFGAFIEHPVLFGSRDEQPDRGGLLLLTEAGDGDLDVLLDGKPRYRVESRPRELTDFEVTCWYHRTSPRSSFTRSVVCSQLTENGRITLSGRAVKRTEFGQRPELKGRSGQRVGERTEEWELPDEAAVLDAYQRYFGIVLEREPVVEAASRSATLAAAWT